MGMDGMLDWQDWQDGTVPGAGILAMPWRRLSDRVLLVQRRAQLTRTGLVSPSLDCWAVRKRGSEEARMQTGCDPHGSTPAELVRGSAGKSSSSSSGSPRLGSNARNQVMLMGDGGNNVMLVGDGGKKDKKRVTKGVKKRVKKR